MNSDIEEIKARLNIVDVIGGYIKLEKAGINYRARCPFHNEKSPSFFVSPSRQIWHCFGGCNEGGDIFKFVMKIEGIDFPDALKLLADKAGVKIRTNSKEWEKMKTERQVLSEICEKACKFFIAQLEKSKTGLEARQYLLKRGLKEETIKDWRLGYAPDTWQGLSDFLIGQGYEREDIIKAGLAIKKDSQKFFDRFRGRIMFPISDLNSQVIGFTGRVFGGKQEEDIAKYLNTPNTLLYDKSRALYGMDKGKLEARQKDFCVLVEGNVDCIMSQQAGIKNCIAVSGTALTPLHLGIIKRYTSNLVLAFDMDLAGNKATVKGIDLALKNGFNVKVISRVSEKDPADIVLLEGEEKWRSLVNGAKPINEFYFELAFKDRDPESLEDKKKIVKDLLPIFKKIEGEIEQSYWIEKLSQRLKIKDADIRAEMRKVRIDGASNNTNDRAAQAEKKPRKYLLEETLLVLSQIDNGKIDSLPIELIDSFAEPIKGIFLKIKGNKDIKGEELERAFADSPETANFLTYILLAAERMKDTDIEADKEWDTCVSELDSLAKKQERDKITGQIKELEEKGLSGEVNDLLEKFNNLTKQ
jgi:DNA primase